MGPSLAIASGLEGRLRPGILDFKGDPPPGGRKTGDSWSEPFSPITPLKLPEPCPSLYWAKGTAAARAAWLQGMETRGLGSRGTKGCSDGWVARPGKWVGGEPGETWLFPCCPEDHPSLPRCWPGNLLATSPTTPDCGQGDGDGVGPELRPPSEFPPEGDSAQGGVVFLATEGDSPTQTPGPAAGIGSSKGGPRSRPCPQPPLDIPIRKPCVSVYIGTMYRAQRSPSTSPPERKKTRQNSSIYSVSGVHLNINCVIFIHFLSLNSTLIYQFNVSWGFFSTGGFSAPPTPTPLFDLRRLILSIVAFRPHVLPCKYAVPCC